MRDDIDDEKWLAALSEDDKLLAALRDALSPSEAVPAWFVETGKNAYAWHNIDAELAQLTYDSDSDKPMATATRAETATIRGLTPAVRDSVVRLTGRRTVLAGQRALLAMPDAERVPPSPLTPSLSRLTSRSRGGREKVRASA